MKVAWTRLLHRLYVAILSRTQSTMAELIVRLGVQTPRILDARENVMGPNSFLGIVDGCSSNTFGAWDPCSSRRRAHENPELLHYPINPTRSRISTYPNLIPVRVFVSMTPDTERILSTTSCPRALKSSASTLAMRSYSPKSRWSSTTPLMRRSSA